MRRLSFGMNLSLDGYIAAPGDDIGWSVPSDELFQWWSGSKAPSSSYEIEGKACEGETIEQCVQLVASPGTDKVDARFRDEECQQLKLSSTGVRLATGPGERCWP